MSRVASPDMMAEINVTPLVDVMLVLLVIFMLVTPAITYSNSQSIAQTDQQTEAKPQRLIVQAGDTLQLDGQSISPSELKQHFSRAVKADAKYSVQIFGEPDASYQSFAEAMAIAKNAGVENLSLASAN
jgi:biopolymer transport protein ExbD